MIINSFFSRWAKGIKSYANSDEGMLLSKLFFLFCVVIGLFVSGVQRFLSGDFWFGVVLVGFGFVTLIDFRLLFKAYNHLLKQNKIFGGL